MKVPRSQMMNARAEFQRVRNDGQYRVGRYLIVSTLADEALPDSKFAFVTSKKVGKAHQRNFVRRRFRDLISRHGAQIAENRYIVMVGRYSTPDVEFAVLEQEFLKLCRKLQILDAPAAK